MDANKLKTIVARLRREAVVDLNAALRPYVGGDGAIYAWRGALQQRGEFKHNLANEIEDALQEERRG